ncbi:hypothetical protein [Streptomyces sp. NPDC048650]|uniref:hypothetical protein n=1 Tax=Streptomyces sp. NPDC048650 TaxID=3365583 RepID=UPI0037236773
MLSAEQAVGPAIKLSGSKPVYAGVNPKTTKTTKTAKTAKTAKTTKTTKGSDGTEFTS